jgi:hypothetical protein
MKLQLHWKSARLFDFPLTLYAVIIIIPSRMKQLVIMKPLIHSSDTVKSVARTLALCLMHFDACIVSLLSVCVGESTRNDVYM